MSFCKLAAQLGVAIEDLQEIAREEGAELGEAAEVVPAEHATMLHELLAGGEGTLDDLEAGAISVEVDETPAE